MPNTPKRPRDLNQWAKRMVEIATGEVEDRAPTPEEEGKDPAAVLKWLANHPRWTFHFTPTSASWLNAVEGFFSTIARRKIRRGVFKSVPQLEDEIGRYIRERNKSAKPFVWTKTAKAIFDKIAEVHEPSV